MGQFSRARLKLRWVYYGRLKSSMFSSSQLELYRTLINHYRKDTFIHLSFSRCFLTSMSVFKGSSAL